MPIPIRALIVSDNEGDALRLMEELRKSDYVPYYERVAAADAFRAALAQKWDLILADHSSGELSAIAALDLLHETGADIPLVEISGFHRARPLVAAGGHGGSGNEPGRGPP